MSLLKIWTAPQLIIDFSKLDFYEYNSDIDYFSCKNGFDTQKETENYFFYWAGSSNINYEEFRIIGYDGSGSAIMIWLIDNQEGKTLIDQPVIVIDSEGSVAPLSANFYDFLWSMANLEVYSEKEDKYVLVPHLIDFAKLHALSYEKNDEKIHELAYQKAGHLEEYIKARLK
jgi:hypothetical protein